MRRRALELSEDLMLGIVETGVPTVAYGNEIAVKPTQACILPETTSSTAINLWPSMHFTASPTQTSSQGPDLLVHSPQHCGEMMRHAGRTLPLGVLGLNPGHALPAPRGMKYPCLAPLISSVYQALRLARGRVLLVAVESPLSRLLAGLLEHSARVYPPPRRQWGRVQGVRREEVEAGVWDTVILWSGGGDEARELLEAIEYKRVLVSPLLACGFYLPLQGARGGLLRVLWPLGLSDAGFAELEKRLLKKTRVVEVGLEHLPLKVDFADSGLIVVRFT